MPGGVASFAYNNGKLSTVTDAAGRTTAFTIDGNGDLSVLARYTYEPVFKKVATSTDFGGHVTSYAYDAKGALVTTTTAMGEVTRMTYDAQGRLSSVTDAEGAMSHGDRREDRAGALRGQGLLDTS